MNPLDRISNKTFTTLCQTLGYLTSRWQDEHEYEDFREYVAHFEKVAAKTDPNIHVEEVWHENNLIHARFRVKPPTFQSIVYSDRYELKTKSSRGGNIKIDMEVIN